MDRSAFAQLLSGAILGAWREFLDDHPAELPYAFAIIQGQPSEGFAIIQGQPSEGYLGYAIATRKGYSGYRPSTSSRGINIKRPGRGRKSTTERS
jgi:hypothetical protein